MSSFPNNLPKTIYSEIVHDKYFQVRKDTLAIQDGQTYDYYTLVAKPIAVMILAISENGKFLINREYRYPTGLVLLSCPGGIKEEDETILECARRELLEETGYDASHFEIIGESYPFPGVTPQKTYFVRATGAFKRSEQCLEAVELIETVLFSKEELKKEIQNHVPLDGLLCTALFFNSE